MESHHSKLTLEEAEKELITGIDLGIQMISYTIDKDEELEERVKTAFKTLKGKDSLIAEVGVENTVDMMLACVADIRAHDQEFYDILVDRQNDKPDRITNQ